MKSITWFGALLALLGILGLGDSCIHDFADQGHCKGRGSQNPEHGALHARHSPSFERGRDRPRHHSHWRRALRKALKPAINS